MPYIGQGQLTETSNYKLLDDISDLFNGTRREFLLYSQKEAVSINSIGSTFIFLDSILLTPNKDYFLSDDGKKIIFHIPPSVGAGFSGRIVQTSPLTLPDNSIDKDKLSLNLHKTKSINFITYSETQLSYDLEIDTESNVIDDDSEVMVFIDGLYQRPTRDYVISGRTITFDVVPPVNSEIDVVISTIPLVKKIIEVSDESIKNSQTICDINSCLQTLDQKIETCTQYFNTSTHNIQWIFNERMELCQQCSNDGNCCEIANGKCCQWTVPPGVSRATFEIWSGGGGGAGMTCCNCCSMGIPAAGGNWAVKTIDVTPGDLYTVCAGGVYSCEQRHACTGGMGCASYVIGNNLNNFCVVGGCGGAMCNGDAHGPRTNQICANCNICPHFGADFGMAGTTGTGNSNTCHCWTHHQIGGTAPWIGLFGHMRTIEYWCNCSCFIPGWAAGGLTGDSTYCGNNLKCCAGGGMGGPGLVKITYF